MARVDDEIELYTAVVWSVRLKRTIRIAYLLKHSQGKSSYVVLFSTNVELSAQHLYRYYKARFQIEFIFRDARQFCGLADCQARGPEALDSHVNASLMALNLAKFDWQEHYREQQRSGFSMASYKRLVFNHHLLERFIAYFELDPSLIKSHPNYQTLLNYGAITYSFCPEC